MKTTILTFLSGCILCSGVFFAAEASGNGKSAKPQNGDKSIIFSQTPNPTIPYSVKFAGDDVDLDRLDMFERLDRELTSLIYGHSNMLLTIKRANRCRWKTSRCSALRTTQQLGGA